MPLMPRQAMLPFLLLFVLNPPAVFSLPRSYVFCYAGSRRASSRSCPTRPGGRTPSSGTTWATGSRPPRRTLRESSRWGGEAAQRSYISQSLNALVVVHAFPLQGVCRGASATFPKTNADLGMALATSDPQLEISRYNAAVAVASSSLPARHTCNSGCYVALPYEASPCSSLLL